MPVDAVHPFLKMDIELANGYPAAHGVRAVQRRLVRCRGRPVLLVLGIQELAVGLLVPPHIAGVTIEHVRAWVNMADDALAGRNARDKLMLDRVAPLIARDSRVGLEAQPLVPEDRVRPG